MSKTKAEIYPVRLKPIVLDKPWGSPGQGPPLMPGSASEARVGEIWLTGDGPRATPVDNGPLVGTTLADLRRQWGPALLGNRLADRIDEPFPLLLKYLHAAEYLSVQVHPDDATAARLEGAGPGKTEAWYIMGAEPPARLVMGLKPEIGRSGLTAALDSGRIEDILFQIQVDSGQAYYIQAGQLHSIGPEITLFEVQQNIDLTYRFFDWHRKDADGRTRELHITKALEAVDLTPGQVKPFRGLRYERPGNQVTILAAGRYFLMERWDVTGEWTGRQDGAMFELLTVIQGRGELRTFFGPERLVPLDPGPTVLLPAAMGEYQISAPEGLSLLRCRLPDLQTDVVEPLLDSGFDSAQIEQLAGPRTPNDLSPLLTAP